MQQQDKMEKQMFVVDKKANNKEETAEKEKEKEEEEEEDPFCQRKYQLLRKLGQGYFLYKSNTAYKRRRGVQLPFAINDAVDDVVADNNNNNVVNHETMMVDDDTHLFITKIHYYRGKGRHYRRPTNYQFSPYSDQLIQRLWTEFYGNDVPMPPKYYLFCDPILLRTWAVNTLVLL